MPQSFYDFYFKQSLEPTAIPPQKKVSSFYNFYMEQERESRLPSLQQIGQMVFGGAKEVGQQVVGLGEQLATAPYPEVRQERIPPGYQPPDETLGQRLERSLWQTKESFKRGGEQIGEVSATAMTGLAGFLTSPLYKEYLKKIKGLPPEEAKAKAEEYAESIQYQPKYAKSAEVARGVLAPFMQIYEPLRKATIKTIKPMMESYLNVGRSKEERIEIPEDDLESMVDIVVGWSPAVKRLKAVGTKFYKDVKFQKVIKQELQKVLKTATEELKTEIKEPTEFVTPEQPLLKPEPALQKPTPPEPSKPRLTTEQRFQRLKEKGLIEEAEWTTETVDEYLARGGKIEEIPPAQRRPGGEGLEYIESELDAVMADVTKDIKGEPPTMGMAIEQTTQRIKAEPYKFQDIDIEAGYQIGKKGIPQQHRIIRGGLKLLNTMKNKVARVYEHLPRTRQFGEAHEALRQLVHQRFKKVRHAIEIERGIIEEFRKDPQRYDLFTRKILLNDLLEEVGRGQEKLPFGFTPEKVKLETTRLDTVLSKHPELQKAVKNRQRIWKAVNNDYTNVMQSLGRDVSHMLTRTDYFRHQVLQYANAKGIIGLSKKLKTPTWRSFLQKRKGYSGIINVDYLQAEAEVLSQMLYDIEVGKTLLKLQKEYDIASKIKTEAKKQGIDPWEKNIPEGHVAWQPREGRVFYMADTIPSKLVVEALAKELEQIGVPIESIKKAWAAGKPYKKWVIPEELAKTLDKVLPAEEPSIIKDAASWAQRKWKRWVLQSPRRFFKYNARNLSGDADAVFVGNPSSFKKVPRATKELYESFVLHKPETPALKDWMDMGGVESMLQAQEMYDIKHNRLFKDLYHEAMTGKLNVIKKYWNTVRGITDFREAILRYASYLDYLEQMKQTPNGMPKNFGGSIREEIMGIKNIKDRAFRLSNDLLGAYDEISVGGKSLRRYSYPFWSWKELNMKRYARFVRNAFYDDKLAMTTARKLTSIAIRSPYLAWRIGKLGIKISGLWTALQLYNTFFFPEVEENLPKEIKGRPHLNLGSTEEGEMVYFTRLGALGDLLDTFGFDELPYLVSDLVHGKKSFKDTAKQIIMSAGNEFYQGLTPVWKAPFELLFRQKTFPDVFDTTTIRDKNLYLMQQLNLGDEYIALSQLPGKPYKKTLPGFFAYTGDPLRTSYEEIFDLKKEFQKQYGKDVEGFWLTPRGNALYHMKLAHRYGDKKAMKKYWEEFVAYHLQEMDITGKPPKNVLQSIQRSAQQSFENMNPLANLGKDERQAFVKSLNEDEREILMKAMLFYQKILLGQEE